MKIKLFSFACLLFSAKSHLSLPLQIDDDFSMEDKSIEKYYVDLKNRTENFFKENTDFWGDDILLDNNENKTIEYKEQPESIENKNVLFHHHKHHHLRNKHNQQEKTNENKINTKR